MHHYQSIESDVQNEESKRYPVGYRSIVFGGLDGVISTITLLCAALGAKMSIHAVIVIGISCIVADGLAVGMGEYLSSKAHSTYIQAERRREQYDYKNSREEEIRSLVLLFQNKGMTEDDAELVALKMSQYENLFVGLMLTEGKGLLAPQDTEFELCADAGTMFLSFSFFGSLPLVALFALSQFLVDEQLNYGICLMISMTMVVLFGFARNSFCVAKTFLMGLQPMGVAFSCGTIAFSASVLLCGALEDTARAF